MARVRIKICGVCRPEDAEAACAAGADAVGMIFHPPSKRNIDLKTAGEIVRRVGPFVSAVGVFVDAPNSTILQTAGSIGLRLVQLNGHEPAGQVEELGRSGLRVLKAVRVDEKLDEQLDGWRAFGASHPGIVTGLVLETGGTGLAGGTGILNDFDRVGRLVQTGAFDGLPPP